MATTYYLILDDADGGVRTNGFEGAFLLSDATFGVFAQAGPRNAGFEPLGLQIEGQQSVATLAGLVAGGQLRDAEVVAVADTGDVVSRLILNDAVVSELTSNVTETAFELTYGEIEVVGSDGQGADTQFSYDVAGAVEIGTPLDRPTAMLADETAAPARTFELLLEQDAMDGAATRFEVLDVAFQIAVPGLDPAIPGGFIGKPAFSAVTLTLATGWPDLYDAAFSGTVLDAVQINGFAPSARGGSDLASRITLGDVAVTGVTRNSDGSVEVVLDYRVIEIAETTGDEADPTELVAFAFDTGVGQAPDDKIALPVQGMTAIAAEAQVDSFYLLLDGVRGPETDSTLFGSFALTDLSFDVSAGRFDTLSMQFENGPAYGILADALTRGTFVDATIVGLSDGAERVFELTVGPAVVSGVADGGAGATDLDLTFDRARLATLSAGDDTLETVFEASQSGAPLPALDPVVVTASTPLGVVGASPEFYLEIGRGIDGDVGLDGVRGSFRVEDVELSLSRDVGLLGSGNIGRAEFGPLVLAVELGDALDTLLNAAATGGILEDVQLVGAPVGRRKAVPYDLRLENAVVADIKAGVDGITLLTLDYQKIEVATSIRNETGTGFDTTSRFGWDVSRNETTSGLSEVAEGRPTPTARPEVFFLAIDGIDGGQPENTAALAGEDEVSVAGTFRVLDLDFGISQPATPFVGSGAGALRPDFTQVTVEVNADAALPELIERLLLSDVFNARVVGLDSTLSDENFDLRLGDARLVAVEDTSDGADILRFEFEVISLKDDQTGGEVFAYDVARNEAAPQPRIPVLPDTTPAVLATEHVLLIDGIDFGTPGPGLETALRIESYDFGIENAVRKPEFGALTIRADLGAVLPDLLGPLALGTVIPSAEIRGADADKSLRFADLRVVGIEDEDGPGDLLELSFGKFQILSFKTAETGEIVEGDGFGWDVARNEVLTEDLPPTNPPPPVNEAPVAVADRVTGIEDTVLSGNVLTNDTDDGLGGPLGAELLSGVAFGTLDFRSDGTFDYTPDENFSGTETFAYRATDGALDSAPVVVTLDVAPVNDAPELLLLKLDDVSEDAAQLTFDLQGQIVDVDTHADDIVLQNPTASWQGGALDVTLEQGELIFDPTQLGADLAAGETANVLVVFDTFDGETTTNSNVVQLSVVGADEVITGTPGFDFLVGSSQNETFFAGAGRSDYMIAGSGMDTFVFAEETSNGIREIDTILGFGADDRLDLGGQDIAFQFSAGGSTILYLADDFDMIFLSGTAGLDPDTQIL